MCMMWSCTYAQFLKNIYENLILFVFAFPAYYTFTSCGWGIDAAHGSRHRSWGSSRLLENIPLANFLLHHFLVLWRADLHWVAHGILSYVLSGHQLWMTIVNDFIDDLINQHKILPNSLFIKHSTIVSKHLHHSIDYVHDERRWNIVFRRRYEIDAKLLCEEVIQALNVL